MNVFRDGVIAFFSAVGMTTVVWLLAGAEQFTGGTDRHCRLRPDGGGQGTCRLSGGAGGQRRRGGRGGLPAGRREREIKNAGQGPFVRRAASAR